MIIVSLGANIAFEGSAARETLAAAVEVLKQEGVHIAAQSGWYRSAPVPQSDQPDYINGILNLETDELPWRLLEVMHAVEIRFGRRRAVRWGARTLDLDLVDYHGFITFNGWRGGRFQEPDAARLCLPHPRAHLRAFVLRPLAEVAPRWRHPVFGDNIEVMMRGPAGEQRCVPL